MSSNYNLHADTISINSCLHIGSRFVVRVGGKRGGTQIWEPIGCGQKTILTFISIHMQVHVYRLLQNNLQDKPVYKYTWWVYISHFLYRAASRHFGHPFYGEVHRFRQTGLFWSANLPPRRVHFLPLPFLCKSKLLMCWPLMRKWPFMIMLHF